MTRKARRDILYDGCYAHIFSRAIEQRFILKDASDFEFFKGLLLEAKRTFGFFIHHYCLMNTHFHLVVSIPNLAALSKALQRLKWQYTDLFNRKYRRKGPLWNHRFKSLLIENEQYLYACGLYVEMNPVKAGMTETPQMWPYSSSGYYFERKEDALVDVYEQPESLPTGIDLTDEKQFTKGVVIGSELFKLQIREDVLQLPVP
jgi:putative transposase